MITGVEAFSQRVWFFCVVWWSSQNIPKPQQNHMNLPTLNWHLTNKVRGAKAQIHVTHNQALGVGQQRQSWHAQHVATIIVAWQHDCKIAESNKPNYKSMTNLWQIYTHLYDMLAPLYHVLSVNFHLNLSLRSYAIKDLLRWACCFPSWSLHERPSFPTSDTRSTDDPP